ncbi:putative quinol monooxygenase [Pseudoalteromonas sp. SSM20]|uniref:putative quinol monooxygenase n=1 Tax=Pseudoalteromonas sp. SSM20 TaxID=3139394 RepID=UPI003BAB72E2
MSKIILQGHILVPDQELVVVKNELATHIELTRQETGCIKFEVVQDKFQLNKFTVYEEFMDQKSFDNHQLRVKSSAWGKVSRNVERHYQITGSVKNV